MKRWLYYSVNIFSVLAFFSSGISPRYGVFWAFLSWTIPFWGVVQASLFAVCAAQYLKRSPTRKRTLRTALHSVLFFLFAPLLGTMYRFGGNNALPAPLPMGAFSVLSFNVHVFNSYPILQQRNPHGAKDLRTWVGKQNAAIQCFQEFYNMDKSADFDMVEQLATKRGYHMHAGASHNLTAPKGYFGTVILSKFPIVARGELPFPKRNSGYQAAIWADVLHGKDTLRVINVHLESYALSGGWSPTEVLPSLATGFAKRAAQVEMLTRFIADTPHKIILTGDFNDLPYSYTYQAIKRALRNAFEAKGSGFGHTHASLRGLPHIRIDNQFYSYGLECLAYRTCYEQQSSDHLPIIAVYR